MVSEGPINPPLPDDELVPLVSLYPGQCARVCERRMDGESCETLNAMGLTDRCVLKACRIGRSCIVQIAATRLGLSREIASQIFVKRLSSAASDSSANG